MAVERIREGHARRPVAVIGDVILRLPAQASGEREVLVYLPVVLDEERAVEDVGLECGGTGGVDQLAGVVAEAVPGVHKGRDRGEGETAVEVAVVRRGIAIVAQPCAELDGLCALGQGREILQLEVIGVGVRLLIGVAASGKDAGHGGTETAFRSQCGR